MNWLRKTPPYVLTQSAIVFISFLSLTPSWSHALQLNSTSDSGQHSKFKLIPAVNVGYNKLMSGYEGYDDLGNAGLDLYFRSGRTTILPTEIHHNLLLRFSFDYFPLQVPEGLYNTTEDLYSLNGAIVYQFHKLGRAEEQQLVPFIGIGIGNYQDRVTINTPASGKITGKENYTGLNASAGLMLPIINTRWPIRFIPEIRYHQFKVPGGLASNMTFQMALCLWPKITK